MAEIKKWNTKKQGQRVVVLVSQDSSDMYFANQLIKNLNVVGVFVEKQHGKAPNLFIKFVKIFKYLIKPKLFIKAIKDNINNKYYGKRASRIALDGFGLEGSKLLAGGDCKVVYTEGINAINEPVYVEEIKKLKPDVIAVCGTSILKRPILSIPVKGVLNIHGGLSQRYRGVWTTLWAIYNEEPEYIGATVHYVSDGIDDGNIIYQGSPEIAEDDNHETLYVKVVKLGIDLMVKAIYDIQNNKVKSYPLKTKGNLYLKKMVTPEIIKEVWEKIDKGFIREYVKNRALREKKVKLF